MDFKVKIDRAKIVGEVTGGNPSGGRINGEIGLDGKQVWLSGIVPIEGWITHPSNLELSFDGNGFKGEIDAVGYCTYDVVLDRGR